MKKISIIVDDKDANTLMSLLSDVRVHELHFETMPNRQEPEAKPARAKRHVDRTGKTTISVVVAHFPVGKPFTKEQAQDLMVRNGFAKSSWSPALSLLIRNGFATATGDPGRKLWTIVKPVPADYKPAHR